MVNDNGYFYCYDINLKNFLQLKKGLRYICHGLSPKSHDPFWQFARNDYLQQCLDEYKNMRLKKV